ncbi:MAG: MBL fold metallo-hydrolase [Anaerolineae bacterium]|nr:MBL fold metallo-hydrolase [Anaerolineae bacterium]
MEIAPGVHLISTAMVNLYVVETTDGPMLVDTGMSRDTPRLTTRLRAMGFDPSRLCAIFLTHGDMDHVGGAAAFRRASGAPTLAHAADLDFIAGRVQRPAGTGPVAAIFGPLAQPIMRTRWIKAPPVGVDRFVVDGETVADGWRVVHLPGHTPGLVGLYHPLRRVLLAGDAVSNLGRLRLPPTFMTMDTPAAKASVHKMAALDFEALGIGHGAPVTRAASAAVKTFAATL